MRPLNASSCVCAPTPAAAESPATSKRSNGPLPLAPSRAPSGSGNKATVRRTRRPCASKTGARGNRRERDAVKAVCACLSVPPDRPRAGQQQPEPGNHGQYRADEQRGDRVRSKAGTTANSTTSLISARRTPWNSLPTRSTPCCFQQLRNLRILVLPQLLHPVLEGLADRRVAGVIASTRCSGTGASPYPNHHPFQSSRGTPRSSARRSGRRW